MVVSFMFLVFGALMGSVANALIYRLPNSISWFKGRSMCPRCKHELGLWDLIPLLSFVFLHGTCRYCHKFIGWRYLLVELICAIGFAYFASIPLSMMLFLSVIIAFMDWETMLVSDILVLLTGFVAFAISFIDKTLSWSSILAFGLPSAVIGGVWFATKGKGMGDGDIALAGVMGLFLGWPKAMYGLWFAFMLGAMYGLILMFIFRKSAKTAIPFGPFLIIGAWIAYTVKVWI